VQHKELFLQQLGIEVLQQEAFHRGEKIGLGSVQLKLQQ